MAMENTQEEKKQKTIVARIRSRIKLIWGKSVGDMNKKIKSSAFAMKLKNSKSKAAYAKEAHPLTDVQKRVLTDLEKDGLAFVHIDELITGEKLFPELQSFVDKEFVHATAGRAKKFLTYLWGNAPIFSLENPIIKLALRSEIVRIADAYIGLYSRFAFFSVNRTVVSENSDAQGSQRWHRDPSLGDERMVKVFLYLNDVTDIGTGPFMYVKGSGRTGRWGNMWRPSQPNGMYPPDGAVEASDCKADITPCFGRAGTLVFCDTTGLHKGGYSTTKERLMATLFYVSPGSLQKPNFSLLEATLEALSREERRLLGK